MSSIRTAIHESLPYIDPGPTPAQRAAAEALIDAELATMLPAGTDGVAAPSSGSTATALTSDHPDLPPEHTSRFTPALQAELSRVASSPDPSKPTPLRAIDLSRYEAQDEDEDGDGGGGGKNTTTQAGLNDALARAHASHTYLRARREHLALLDGPEGRNSWLVGNWQLESELRSLEAELVAKKREVDLLALRRRRAQDEVGAEMRGLEEGWRRGVGKVLEVEVATVGLRAEIEARRRAALTGLAV